jgi:tRNA dimethylallyltransferase
LKLIVIAGPTAVGKTDLAIEIALDLGCDIISADSRQLYKEITIGTAKPSTEELKLVRHHFINHISIHEYFSAGRYETEVIEFLDHYNNPCILMVGGSGLYIKAICEGIDDLPGPDLMLRMSLQKRFEEKGLKHLTDELHDLDIDTFNTIDLQNPKRIIRALEIIHQTGKKYSRLKNQDKKNRNFDVLKIGLNLPRDILFERINTRVDKMINSGLLEEVKSLIPWKDLIALQTVGYTEFFEYLEGSCDLEEAIRLCKRNTRRYAKRQLTWFRKDDGIHWFSPKEHQKIQALIKNFIANS